MRTSLFGLILLALQTCGGQEDTASPDQVDNMEMANEASAYEDGSSTKKMVAADDQTPAAPVAEVRRIIRQGHLRFVTAEAATTHRAVARATQAAGGYVTEDNTANYQERTEYQLTVRVPADRFDAFVAEVEGLASHVESKHITASDVTEQFVDVEARLQTKKMLEARYRELLPQASRVEDILRIEQEANSVRAEIESLEGRLKYLRNQTALSTLNLTFFERGTATTSGFLYRVGSALGQGWGLLQSFVVAVATLWPFVLLSAAATWLTRRIRQRRRARERATHLD